MGVFPVAGKDILSKPFQLRVFLGHELTLRGGSAYQSG
jgi:hypothetical protein